MRSKTFQSPPKTKPPSRHPSTSMVPGDLPTTKKVRFEESGPPRPISATPAAPIEESGQPSSLADSGRTELPATYLNHAQPTPVTRPYSIITTASNKASTTTLTKPIPNRHKETTIPPPFHPSTSMVPGDLPAAKKVHFKESGPPHPIPGTPAAPMEESGQPSSLADSGRTELSATYSNHAEPLLLVIEGFVTQDNLTVAPGPTTIDLDACQAMHIIDLTPHGYGVKYDDQHIFPLPYHNSYSIQDPAHFKTPLLYLATVPSSDDHLAEPATSATAAPNHTEVTQHYETIEAPILGPTGPSMPTSTQESIQGPDLASHPIIQQLVNSQASMQTDLHEQKQIVLEMKNMLSAFIHLPSDPPAY